MADRAAQIRSPRLYRRGQDNLSGRGTASKEPEWGGGGTILVERGRVNARPWGLSVLFFDQVGKSVWKAVVIRLKMANAAFEFGSD